MLKQRHGFTLIELLAVIVILAIIAVIATPIITGIIEDAKKSAFERSVEGIVKGTETDVALKLDDNGYTYTVEDGKINNLDENIKISNTDGFNGSIKYDSEANVSYAIHNDKWCRIKKEESATTIKYVDGECNLAAPEVTTRMYDDGNIVYYDVVNGGLCTNYHEDNSKTGYNGLNGTGNQTSCLKFYSFNDDEGDSRVNLILDHNTTELTYWTDASTSINKDGPKEILTELRKATDSWKGTETPDNYTVSQTGSGNYTIPYKDESYKARLITTNEIAEITGNTTFNESTTDFNENYFFDSNKTEASSTCDLGNTTGCKYGWLYDRTGKKCLQYGCLNMSDVEQSCYWTATSALGLPFGAWFVNGHKLEYYTINTNSFAGVRPVIEVSKANL